jgi:hypothetical protein
VKKKSYTRGESRVTLGGLQRDSEEMRRTPLWSKVGEIFEAWKRGLGRWEMVSKVVSLQNNVRTPKQDNMLQYKPQNLRGINKISLLSQNCNIYQIYISNKKVITTAQLTIKSIKNLLDNEALNM